MLAHPVYAQIRDWTDLPGCLVDGDVATLKCFEVIAGNVLIVASAFIILVLFAMFIVGAFHYLTSGGNPERVKKAQSTLRYALIGLVLFLSAYLILRIIGTLFLQDPNALFIFEIE